MATEYTNFIDSQSALNRPTNSGYEKFTLNEGWVILGNVCHLWVMTFSGDKK
jgi:hypothetical protein